MHTRAGDLVGVAVLATVLTVLLAWPVLRAPDTRVFGVPLVGTHHDPFTMMQIWERPVTARVGFQPVTDVPGHWLAVAVGPVAAYNWLVLLTFPFTAIVTFALARVLAISRGGAVLAALACAFSPFHLAHAAYHPHIAQVQWIPLYILAVGSALRHGSGSSLIGLGLATIAVVLSNFYAGWSVAVLTPVIVGGGVYVLAPFRPRWIHVAATLAFVAAGGLAYVVWVAPAIWSAPGVVGVSPTDVAAYSARPVAYVMQPAAHPWLGSSVTQFWHNRGVGVELLEQQVSLGWGIVGLAGVAIGAWLTRTAPSMGHSLRAVPALLAIGMSAAVLSASPSLVMGSGLHALAPMFRAYARFGVVTHLMAVLLAGIGWSVLRARATTTARALGVALVALVAAEYVVAPTAASRELWPTAAHRWVHDHPTGLRVLDCVAHSAPTASDPWLTRGRVQLLGGSFPDCGEPHLPGKLAALGFTHLLVRAWSDDAALYAPETPQSGLDLVLRDKEASLWRVSARVPSLYVDTMSGLLPRQRDQERSWRLMETSAQWSLMNPGPTSVAATLRLELSAFGRDRVVDVALNGTVVQHVAVSPGRDVYVVGPLLVPRGHHALTFTVAEPDVTIAFGGWRWTTIPEVQ